MAVFLLVHANALILVLLEQFLSRRYAILILMILIGVLVCKERCVDLVLAGAQHKFLLMKAHISRKYLVLLLASGMFGLLSWEIAGFDHN